MKSLLGVTPRVVNASSNPSAVRSTPAKFVTPFKAGMRPGEKGRVALEGAKKEKDRDREVLSSSMVVPMKQRTGNMANVVKGNAKRRWKAFDLCEFSDLFFFPHIGGSPFVVAPPPNRQSLASSGFVPQSYDFDDLEAMGMYVYPFRHFLPSRTLNDIL
jgi:breast cancer 2 susceptibility protein